MILDLHIHSEFSSDCFTPVDIIIKTAKKVGLDGIAITDHDTIDGALKAKKFKNSDFEIIIGSEIQLDNGAELLGLFLNDRIRSSSFFDVYDEIKDQDGILILPHPFRAAKKNIDLLTSTELSNIKFIEGINAGNTPLENDKAIKLAEEKSLIMIAGSDAHHFSSIGKAYTLFPKSDGDLRRQLKNGNVQIYGNSLTKLERQREYLGRELKLKNYKKIIQDSFKNIKDKI